MMQYISMTGKMSASMPLILRGFGSSMNFTNGETGLYCAFAICENANTSSGFSRTELLVSSGKSPHDYYREVIVGFGFVSFLVTIFILFQLAYIYYMPKKTQGMYKKFWVNI